MTTLLITRNSIFGYFLYSAATVLGFFSFFPLVDIILNPIELGWGGLDQKNNLLDSKSK
jgi:hypothetical protein